MNYLNIKEKEGHFEIKPDIFYKGSINQIEKKTIPYVITINSIFREDYYGTTSSNFFYELPLEVKNVVSLKILDAQIPRSYYNVNKEFKNNFFIIKNESTNRTERITIPDGNYTNKSLIDTLNLIFSKFTNEFKFINFYINEISNNGIGETIIGLSNLSPYIFNFTIDFDSDFVENSNTTGLNENLKHKLGWLLGFRYNLYSNKSVYISEAFIETETRTTAFVYLNDFNKNNCDHELELIKNECLTSDNIIANIILRDEKTNFMTYKIFSPTRNYFGPVSLKRIHIKLLDIYGKNINLNNNDWNFTLLLEIIYNL